MHRLVLLLCACGSSGPPSHGATGPLATITGKAFVFGAADAAIDQATVSIAEAPQLTATTDGDNAFSMQAPSGGECSFTFRQAGFPEVQTATLPVGAGGLEHVSFQAPSEKTFNLLAAVVGVDPDPARCQIATTVSAVGTAIYGGPAMGEPDATVTIDPPLASGPVYFKYVNDTLIYPDTSLTATTIDGGVIYTNVPPGEYRLAAHKAGKQFTSVKIRCRASVLVNAAPPWGLQGL